MKKILYFSFLFLFLFAQACEDDDDSELDLQIKADDKAIREYLDENNITAEKTESGVYLQPLVENPQGTAMKEGDVVSIVYTMKLLLANYPIETYSDTLNPVKFSNTEESLMPVGLNSEIGRMRKGEKYRFFIPSNQAYLDYENMAFFGEYSNFIIDVEVVDLKTEQQEYEFEMESVQNFVANNYPSAQAYSSGLYIQTTKEGSGGKPSNNGKVRFHFTRKYLDGSVIETTTDGDPIDVYFSENRLVRGLEQGIKEMSMGSEAILIMPSALAFGKSVQILPIALRQSLADKDQLNSQIPEVRPYSPVLYEVQLLSVY